MESSGPNRVRGDSGSHPNSLVSVDGGQASHAPTIHEQGQAIGATIDILQQIAKALQRATQPTQVAPKRATIKKMEKY